MSIEYALLLSLPIFEEKGIIEVVGSGNIFIFNLSKLMKSQVPHSLT